MIYHVFCMLHMQHVKNHVLCTWVMQEIKFSTNSVFNTYTVLLCTIWWTLHIKHQNNAPNNTSSFINIYCSFYCQAQPKPQLQFQLGAEVVIFPASPGRPAGRPSRIVLSKHNTSLLPKVKLFNLTSRAHKWIMT